MIARTLLLALLCAVCHAAPRPILEFKDDSGTCSITKNGNKLDISAGCEAGAGFASSSLESRVAAIEALNIDARLKALETAPAPDHAAKVASLKPYVWYKNSDIPESGFSWKDSGSGCGNCDLTAATGPNRGAFPPRSTAKVNGKTIHTLNNAGGMNQHCMTNRKFSQPQGRPMTVFAIFDQPAYRKSAWAGYPMSFGDHNCGSESGNCIMTIEVESPSNFDIAYGWGRDTRFHGQWPGAGWHKWVLRGASRSDMRVSIDGQNKASNGNSHNSDALPNRNHLSLGCLDFEGNQAGHAAQNTQINYGEFIYFDRKLTDSEVATVSAYLQEGFGL